MMMRRTFSLLTAGFLMSSTLAAQNPPPQSGQQQSGQQQSAPPQSQTQIDVRKAPPPPPPTPTPQGKNTIRTITELVEIDVQVLGKDGKPVKGLKQDQFHVAEDGKAQNVSSLDYYDIEKIETAAATDVNEPIVVALGAVSEPEKVRAAVRDHRLMVLFFDMTSLQPEDLIRSTSAAQKFLKEQMSPADLVGVVAFGNQLTVLAEFTNDREYLQTVVARLVPGKDSALADLAGTASDTVTEDSGDAFTGDNTEFNIFNTDRKLDAMRALADLLRELPGKKSVIQFTSGITQTGEENRSELRATTDAAQRDNVSFYTVDSRGLMAAPPGGDATTGASTGSSMFSGASVFRQSQARHDSRDTLATLANDTGGKAFFDMGDFGQVFKAIESDTAGYYLVGYYSTNHAQDGKWRRVSVKVDVPGVKIRAREGYYAPKNFGVYTAEDRERQLEEAMRSSAPRVELPVAIETAHFRINKNEIYVPISVKIASSALRWADSHGKHQVVFDFIAEAREEHTGRIAATLRDTITVKLDTERFQQLQQQSIVYQGGMILGPGTYTLKFLARENESGRVGTFEQNMEVPAVSPDKLQISSVLLSSQLQAIQKTNEVEKKALAADARMKTSPLDIAGERIIPSVTRVFTPQQPLYVFFQAYLPPKADGEKLRAGLVFFYNGQRVNATPLVEPAEVDAKTQTASFRLNVPLDKFAPGRYTIQTVVVETGGELAAFSRAYFALRPPAAAAPKPAAPGPSAN
jgi:VWFA-related protein